MSVVHPQEFVVQLFLVLWYTRHRDCSFCIHGHNRPKCHHLTAALKSKDPYIECYIGQHCINDTVSQLSILHVFMDEGCLWSILKRFISLNIVSVYLCVFARVWVVCGCRCGCGCTGVWLYILSSIPIRLWADNVLIPHLGQHEPNATCIVSALSIQHVIHKALTPRGRISPSRAPNSSVKPL